MNTIIAGSRNILKGHIHVADAVKMSHFVVTEVVSGTARGIDQAGEMWAMQHDIPVKRFPADWDMYGKSAGYRRNTEMAEYANALIAIWDGQSRGTKHMIDEAAKRNLEVFVYRVNP